MTSDPSIPLPTPEYLANCRWIETHIDELMAEHSDKWVAVDNGQLIAADRHLGKVTAEARRVGASQHVAYEFLAGVFTIL